MDTTALLPGARMRTTPEQAMRAVYTMRRATVAPQHAELYRRLLALVMSAAGPVTALATILPCSAF